MSQAVERYARVSELFQAATELLPQDRAAFLENECAEDASLRREVEALLETDAQSDGFIEQPITALPVDLLSEEEFAGRHFGPYEVIREIGRGGLGAVYLAVRSDGEYRKEVALKLIRRGLDTDDILRRFRTADPLADLKPVATGEQILALGAICRQVHVGEAIESYILSVVRATRDKRHILPALRQPRPEVTANRTGPDNRKSHGTVPFSTV